MASKLSECEKQATYLIVDIYGDDEIKRYFRNVGIYKKQTITLIDIINKHCIVFLKGSRYAMKNELASCLMVEKHD